MSLLTRMITFRLVVFTTFILLISSSSFAEMQSSSNPWVKSYSLESRGYYSEAAELIRPMIKNGDTKEFALLRVAWLSYWQQHYNEAIDGYQQALRLNKNSFNAKLGISLPLMAQRRWREASRYLQQVIDESTWNYTANVRLLECLQKLRLWQKIKPLALGLAKHYPAEALPFIYLARALLNEGDDKNSLHTYRQVLLRSPTNQEAIDALKP